jgi:hypothetical protein
MAAMSEQAKVSSETLEKLKKLKKDLNLKSIDIVIQHLLACLEGSDKGAAEDLDSEEEVQGPEKRRKKNVRPPLFSFKILKDRPEMLEFYNRANEFIFIESGPYPYFEEKKKNSFPSFHPSLSFNP